MLPPPMAASLRCWLRRSSRVWLDRRSPPLVRLVRPLVGGRWQDEEALESILRCGVPYVGLVASRTRGAAVRRLLEELGVPGVATIRNPAGLDLGARTPPEVALSILAEIVQARPSGVPSSPPKPAATSPAVATQESATAIDPVCKMSVAIASARQKAEVDGVVYYFCCAKCRATFLNDPQAYLTHL